MNPGWHIELTRAVTRYQYQGDIMPASRSDIAELRGILYAFESGRALSEADQLRYAPVLRRMIDIMESGDPASPLWWSAGALIKAMRKQNGMYVTTDRALETWALDKIFELMGDGHETAGN